MSDTKKQLTKKLLTRAADKINTVLQQVENDEYVMAYIDFYTVVKCVQKAEDLLCDMQDSNEEAKHE